MSRRPLLRPPPSWRAPRPPRRARPPWRPASCVPHRAQPRAHRARPADCRPPPRYRRCPTAAGREPCRGRRAGGRARRARLWAARRAVGVGRTHATPRTRRRARRSPRAARRTASPAQCGTWSAGTCFQPWPLPQAHSALPSRPALLVPRPRPLPPPATRRRSTRIASRAARSAKSPQERSHPMICPPETLPQWQWQCCQGCDHTRPILPSHLPLRAASWRRRRWRSLGCMAGQVAAGTQSSSVACWLAPRGPASEQPSTTLPAAVVQRVPVVAVTATRAVAALGRRWASGGAPRPSAPVVPQRELLPAPRLAQRPPRARPACRARCWDGLAKARYVEAAAVAAAVMAAGATAAAATAAAAAPAAAERWQLPRGSLEDRRPADLARTAVAPASATRALHGPHSRSRARRAYCGTLLPAAGASRRRQLAQP